MTTQPAPFLAPPSITGPELRPEWSKHLVMDVALGTTTDSILETHQLQYHQFQQICDQPMFVLAVEALRKELSKDGATFKLKAQLQADFYLAEVHKKIMHPDTDEKVFVRLVEDVVRWGGLDAPASVGGGPGMGGFSIEINFGQAGKRGITIDGDNQ